MKISQEEHGHAGVGRQLLLQAKVAVSRNGDGDGDDDADAAEVEVELPSVAGAATAQGDFLERLAAAKSRAQSVES